MHVLFSSVRCPSCGSTFETGASVATPGGEVAKTCLPADQGQHGAMFAPLAVLHSWKDISTYLGRGVRTAQRWEHDLGFPVHRLNRQERGAVFAFPEEIKQWLHRTPVGVTRKPALGSGTGELEKAASALREPCA